MSDREKILDAVAPLKRGKWVSASLRPWTGEVAAAKFEELRRAVEERGNRAADDAALAGYEAGRASVMVPDIIAQPPPVCTGSHQAIVGYVTFSPQRCPICERDIQVISHALGHCFALHAYQPARPTMGPTTCKMCGKATREPTKMDGDCLYCPACVFNRAEMLRHDLDAIYGVMARIDPGLVDRVKEAVDEIYQATASDNTKPRVSDTPCSECGHFAVVAGSCFVCAANGSLDTRSKESK